MTRRITVDVYEADGTTHVGLLASDAKRSFLKDLSAEGSFSLEVKLGHADEAFITDGRIVRYSIDGTARWQGLIEPRSIVYADPGNREAGRAISVSGRGLLAMFEWVPIYPELGLGRVSPDTRYFSVASSAYNASSFPSATAFHKVNTTTTSDPYYGKPASFPDGDAYWIGPSDGVASLPAPIGFYWLVPEDAILDVPVGEGGDYRFSISADDGFELFVDGNKEAAEARAGLFAETRQVTLPLDEGTHRLAVRVENFDRTVSASNATAAVVSVAKELDGGDTLDTPIERSDATWQIYEVFGADEPGMTPGFILDLLLTEAQANGYLTGLTWDFDGDFDSDANSWLGQIDVAFPVGSSLLDVIRHFVDEHIIDVEMDATGLVLHAYASKGDNLTATVSATYGDNLGRLGFSVKPPGANAALSRTAEGRWVEKVRSASVTAWGKRGVHLSLGSAPSATSADRQADAYFDDNSEPVEALTDVQIEEVTDIPLVDFDVGDSITATTSDGATAACRVQGISVSEDDAGNPVWAPDLVKTAATRTPRSAVGRQDVVNSMALGNGGGRSAVVTPTSADPSPMRAVSGVTEAAEFSQYGTVTLTTTADGPEFVVGSRGGSGGLIDAGTLSLTTAGSSSTVVTIYVNGVSIGTITYASSDTTPQTDALTATRVVVGDRVKARVTTAGTGASGLSTFVPIKP